MPAKTAPKKAAAPASRAAKPPRAEAVTLDLTELVARYGPGLTAFQKPVPFDFDHIAATAYHLILATPDGTRATNLVTYNGKLSPRQARHLDALDRGTPVADVESYLARLEKKGYTAATVAVAVKKGRRKGK